MPNNTITLQSDNARTFVEFTRVYKMAGSCEVKSQPVSIALEEVSSVRPSNRLGKANHRSTVTMNNGTEIELADLYSSVTDTLNWAA